MQNFYAVTITKNQNVLSVNNNASNRSSVHKADTLPTRALFSLIGA